MSGSTVNCRGGLRGPDGSKSTCLSVRETWSKMSAGLWSCSPSGCFCPTVLVMSGGCTASCDGPDGPGDSVGSLAGKAHAPFVAILSCCCSCSGNWGWSAGTADSTGTSWASSSSWWMSLSTSAFTSTCSWSKSSAPSPALPFWLSSMMLSMIYRREEIMIQTNTIMKPLSYSPHVQRAQTTSDTQQDGSQLLVYNRLNLKSMLTTFTWLKNTFQRFRFSYIRLTKTYL